jgi:hypothetical protein
MVICDLPVIVSLYIAVIYAWLTFSEKQMQ